MIFALMKRERMKLGKLESKSMMCMKTCWQSLMNLREEMNGLSGCKSKKFLLFVERHMS